MAQVEHCFSFLQAVIDESLIELQVRSLLVVVLGLEQAVHRVWNVNLFDCNSYDSQCMHRAFVDNSEGPEAYHSRELEVAVLILREALKNVVSDIIDAYA